MSITCSGVGKSVVSSIIAGVTLASLALPGYAHDELGMLLSSQPPYAGQGWTKGDGTNGGGLAGVDFPASGVTLLSWVSLAEFSGTVNNANVVEGYVSASGREYAIIGLSNGTGFVEVTDPGAPVIVAQISGPDSLWRDIRTYQNYCYAVSEGGGGIQVMDMSNIDSGTVASLGNVTTGGTASTHTVYVNKDSGYLYRCGGSSSLGLRMYRLNNPAAPEFIGTALPNRYIHECQVVTYQSGPYAGKEIAFCYSEDTQSGTNPGVDILDVSDKANIDHLSTAQYANGRFSHQGWLSADYQYIYINDETDQNNPTGPYLTRIVDVTDLENPVYAGTFDNGAGAIDHNLYLVGNLIFESNYRSGLRIFDATDPLAPVEVGFFDTYPSDNGAAFNGLWDNDPFLPSGIILGADIEKGLFVWSLGINQLEFDYPDGVPSLLDPAGDSMVVQISELDGSLQSGTAKLFYDIGSGFVEVSLTPQGGDLFLASFPPIECGDEVSFYFSAQTTNGITVRSPSAAPGVTFNATTAVDIQVAYSDTLETNTGWVAGIQGDNAATGIWTRVDPIGTAAQPENDHTADPGVTCWVTGQGPPGGGLGEADVDSGTTTLTTNTLDATIAADPYVSYARWYSNNTGGDPNTDTMPIQISNNDGASWTQLELVSENAGEWVVKRFRIADFVPPTNQIKLRFIARDLNGGSVVEAAIDDLEILDYDCIGGVLGDITGDNIVDIDDLFEVIAQWGTCPGGGKPCSADVTGDGNVDIDDLFLVIGEWS